MSVTYLVPLSAVVKASALSLRRDASAYSAKFGSLPKETVLTVFEERMNENTKWLRVQTPSGIKGWVAAAFVALGGPKKPRVDRGFIIKTMQDLGWSVFAGYGMAANSFQESSFDPDAVGDLGKAYGLFQWHTDRQEIFKALFGKSIQESTAAEQLKFLDWELRNSEHKAGDAMKAAKNAYEAGSQFSRLYERPRLADIEAERRGKRALEWFNEDRK
jgi:hypothetical protein